MNQLDSGQWQATIVGLRRRWADAEKVLEDLENLRRPLVLASKTGDRVAQAQLNGVNDRVREARREWDDLKTALEEAELCLTGCQAAEADARHQQRVNEARELATERIEAAAQVDEAMSQLAEAFENYWQLGLKLERYSEEHEISVTLQSFPLAQALVQCSRPLANVLTVREAFARSLADHERDLWSKLMAAEPELVGAAS